MASCSHRPTGGAQLLSKPFRKLELTETIRRSFDNAKF